jgi:hypothetical protein
MDTFVEDSRENTVCCYELCKEGEDEARNTCNNNLRIVSTKYISNLLWNFCSIN